MIIIENAATWHSYGRWNEAARRFSAVIYGKGLQATESIVYLHDVFATLGGLRPVFYFGDLDPPGLQIPQHAFAFAKMHALPPVEPHAWSYRHLLSLGAGKDMTWDGEPASRADCDWLGELADGAWAVLSAGKRLAQEHVGWEFLESAT